MTSYFSDSEEAEKLLLTLGMMYSTGQHIPSACLCDWSGQVWCTQWPV